MELLHASAKFDSAICAIRDIYHVRLLLEAYAYSGAREAYGAGLVQRCLCKHLPSELHCLVGINLGPHQPPYGCVCVCLVRAPTGILLDCNMQADDGDGSSSDGGRQSLEADRQMAKCLSPSSALRVAYNTQGSTPGYDDCKNKAPSIPHHYSVAASSSVSSTSTTAHVSVSAVLANQQRWQPVLNSVPPGITSIRPGSLTPLLEYTGDVAGSMGSDEMAGSTGAFAHGYTTIAAGGQSPEATMLQDQGRGPCQHVYATAAAASTGVWGSVALSNMHCVTVITDMQGRHVLWHSRSAGAAIQVPDDGKMLQPSFLTALLGSPDILSEVQAALTLEGVWVGTVQVRTAVCVWVRPAMTC